MILKENAMNIAVFDAEAIKALPIIRSLGKAGYNIFTFSFERLSLGGSSNYSRKNFYLKNFNIAWLKLKLHDLNIKNILPLEDTTIEFFHNNSHDFRAFNIIMPEFEDFMLFHDKANTMKYAERLQITIPSTFIPESVNEAENFLKSQKNYPLVLKPRKSTGSRGLKVVYTSSEAVKKYRIINNTYRLPIIQEYIPTGGQAIGAEFLFYKGREIMSFSHLRIREFPVAGGPSTYCQAYQHNEPTKIARRLFQELNYSGFAMVEFKEHPLNKKLYLMEVNPRPWGSISLPISAGLNFPVEAVEIFTQPETKAREQYIETSKKLFMRWFLPGDLLSILFNNNMSFSEKITSLLKKYPDTVYQIINRHDFPPTLTMIIKMCLNCFNIEFIKRNLLRQ